MCLRENRVKSFRLEYKNKLPTSVASGPYEKHLASSGVKFSQMTPNFL